MFTFWEELIAKIKGKKECCNNERKLIKQLLCALLILYVNYDRTKSCQNTPLCKGPNTVSQNS